MKQYQDLLIHILKNGKVSENRTSQKTRSIWGYEIRHNLKDGFPLLTTKKVYKKSSFVEMLGFLRGETDIRWYQDRGCNIWNKDHHRWHNEDLERDKKEYEQNKESIEFRINNPYSLGEIYGHQWRNFSNSGYDQLKEIIKELENRSYSRRLIMSAWAPNRFHMMCLPPCHVDYHFTINNCSLDIICHQRSCDAPLGLPFNLANLGLMNHLVANRTGLLPGEIIWHGGDVHIYENQIPKITEQLFREPFALPSLELSDRVVGSDPWEVEYEDIKVVGYKHHGKIDIPLTVS